MMAITQPNLNLTSSDKRMILLLCQLLEESTQIRGNIPPTEVGLADNEAQELADAIQHKLESKEFWQAAALIEKISQGNRADAREIYLKGRSTRGASRIMSSNHYHQFLARLGFERPHLPGVREMEFEHFIRMERRAWGAIGVSPPIMALLEKFLRTHQSEINGAKSGRNAISSGEIIRQVRSIQPKRNVQSGDWNYLLDTNKLAGALTLFTNMGVMFSTRDWSVTSTMSTLAGSVGLVVGK